MHTALRAPFPGAILTADEIEAREARTALLEEVRERSLAALELVDHSYEALLEVRKHGGVREANDFGVSLKLGHDLA